jgi:amino acid transporter
LTAIDPNLRDAGLIRGITPFALASGIVNGVVGAGIFVLPASMALFAGAYATLAFFICAVAMGAVVVCFAEAGSRVPTSGGVYGFVEAAFGPGAGLVAGMLVWVSSVLACGGIASAAAAGVSAMAPGLGGPLPRAAVILAIIGSIVAVNLQGVRAGARLVSVATSIKMVPLLLFVGVGGVAVLLGPHHAAQALPATDFGRAAILGIFALCGMETVLSASGEVKDPARTLPRALFGAAAFVLALYVAIQLVAQGLLGADLAASHTPLADALGQVDPGLRLVMLVGATVSMIGWIGSDILGAPRLLFAFARDGALPRPLGRLHPGTQVPATAIAVHSAIAAGCAIAGGFEELAVLSTLDSAALYAAACAAAVVLQRRGVAQAGTPLGFRAVPACAAVGVASMVALCLAANWAELAGLAATVVACVALHAVQARARRT